MQSKITIEVDFANGNEPVIQIISRSTDDIRDKLINNFFGYLQGTSSWCSIYCNGVSGNGQQWTISPIKPSQFKEEATAMMEQWRIENEPQTESASLP